MTDIFEIPANWEDPEGLQELLALIRDQRPNADIRKVRLAYYVAELAHKGVNRASGEPYITHPLAVAHAIAELRMDDASIIAGLLHDTIEDTKEESERDALRRKILATFGEEIVELVDGVTKLRFRDLPTDAVRDRATAESHRAAESLRKMLLAMARDVRVMVIKLADRLHNMRTLEALSPERRTRIANETLDIYAPLAARLGIWQIKWQLEDLAFKHLHPKEFQQISEMVAKSRTQREEELNTSILILKERMQAKGITGFEVHGRPKHLYSIFNKMVHHGFEFEQILDLLALRIIVADKDDCYLALMIVHDLWLPVPGLFFDYIAQPKPNGYQSLHTKVVGPHGEPLEVQIRTQAMHELAEFGVAAHWAYKEAGEGASADASGINQLRDQLFDWTDVRTSSDFLRTVSSDLFSEQVFVFTPKGDVLDLPKDSTPIDFAFRVHSSLGLTVIGAKVNGVQVPLATKLKNGDVVELVTRSNAQPSLDWLEFVKSQHARSKIRAYFRRRNKTENAQRGRDGLERELKSAGLDPKAFLGEEKLNAVAKLIHGCENDVDLLAKVGEGLISVNNVVMKLRGITPQQPKPEVLHVSRAKEGQVGLVTAGVSNLVIKRARCCDPVPGEDVLGYVSRGRGILVHRKLCPNVMRMQINEPQRLVPLDWQKDGGQYAVNIKIITMNRQGLLMDVSTIFGESKTNVSAAKIKTLPNQTAELDVTVEVTDVDHLQSVMTKISNFQDVISIARMFGRTAGK